MSALFLSQKVFPVLQGKCSWIIQFSYDYKKDIFFLEADGTAMYSSGHTLHVLCITQYSIYALCILALSYTFHL